MTRQNKSLVARGSAMVRLSAIVVVLGGSTAVALAQLTETPGPGGIPIAPGAPVRGYTPGGVGVGGGRVAPGPAARDVPMYREAPGGVPVLVTPPGSGDGRDRGAATRAPDCGRRSCLPDSLRLTIASDDKPTDTAGPPDAPIDSVGGLFAALRACWVPPPADQRQPGMQMTVRFGLDPTGALMGPPFVTYATRGASPDTRQAYRRAITASLEGCVAARFSDRFGSAVAGRPLFVRYVDGRGPGSGSPPQRRP